MELTALAAPGLRREVAADRSFERVPGRDDTDHSQQLVQRVVKSCAAAQAANLHARLEIAITRSGDNMALDTVRTPREAKLILKVGKPRGTRYCARPTLIPP